MTSLGELSDGTIKTVALNLGSGWSGRAVSAGVGGQDFLPEQWSDCLQQPELLFEDVKKILKTDGRNCVAVKNLAMGSNQLKVVAKRHWPKVDIRQFFRSFQAGKALRNFKTAVELFRLGIPITEPLAALHQRQYLLVKQSIYITRYFENSSNLYAFACERLPSVPGGSFAVKKDLCSQLAGILAALHKNNLWHRDSKATNFIVCRDAQRRYKIYLADIDGIKRYILRRRNCQLRSLWQLAASVVSIPTVNRTDYLRTFRVYCGLVGIDESQRHRIFRELAGCARVKHLQSVRKTADGG